MQSKYYLFISFDEKNKIQCFMLHDVEKEKIYNGDTIIMDNCCNYSEYKGVIGFETAINNGLVVPISKNVFDKSMLLNYNDLRKMTICDLIIF